MESHLKLRCQVLSQRLFPNRQLPNCEIYKVATSQVCLPQLPSPHPIPTQLQRSLPPLQPAVPQKTYNLTFGKFATREMFTWKPFEYCQVGSRNWENTKVTRYYLSENTKVTRYYLSENIEKFSTRMFIYILMENHSIQS